MKTTFSQACGQIGKISWGRNWLFRCAALAASSVRAAGQTLPEKPGTNVLGTPSELISAVVEIVQVAGEKLEGPLFALALLPALGILGFVAHPIHKNEGLTRAFLVLIALAMALVVSYGAYEMAVTAQGLSSSDHLPPEAFIPRGETADLGPFRVALEEVDTLKKKKVPRPWQWNRSTFGDEALSDFLVNSRVRISRDFKVDDPDDTKWPTPEQFMRVDSEDEWTKLLEPLKA